MAKMIPPQYEQATTSAAERRIFHLLENDPGTSESVVFHSMALSKRPTGPYGEIDFVLLVPSGAVVCLEVKGGRVSCKDGVWRTIDRFGATTEFKKSHFMQAREGMFAILQAIREKSGDGSEACKCLFAYAVVFPDVDSPPKSPEFEAWESIGRDRPQAPVSGIILKIVDSQRKKLGDWRPPASPESYIRDIRQFLRPDFERVILRPTVIKECESAIVPLTADQYIVLDIISNNPRCLIEGAAGTGKTALALDYSRRQAQTGENVLLLCLNPLLGERLQSSAEQLGDRKLQANSYFRFLRELTMASVYREEFERAPQSATPEKVFSDVLPFYAQLSAEALNSQFDLLVTDEAQDLLNTQALEILGTLLKGGIAGGQWHFFGDFTRQCVYSGSPREKHSQTLRDACPYFTQTQLQTNCRNTRHIGEETALLSGFSSLPYKPGQIDGLPVDYRYWRNREQQLEKLSEVARLPLHEGMSPLDIVLLSPRTFADSVASTLSCPTKKHGTVSAMEIRKGAFPFAGNSKLGFATIQSFKGMESPVIIPCDVERVEDDEPQALLYTGMSRARSLLVMKVRDSVKEAIARSFMRKLKEEWKS
jgi:Nuclease-related domain/Type III restriction enzyme, res subunit